MSWRRAAAAAGASGAAAANNSPQSIPLQPPPPPPPGASPPTTTSSRSGGCTTCTNITIMQLFHELKQQFPAVADEVVSACIADHCHNRNALQARLQRETAAVPRTQPYPRSPIMQPKASSSDNQTNQTDETVLNSDNKTTQLVSDRKPPLPGSPGITQRRFPHRRAPKPPEEVVKPAPCGRAVAIRPTTLDLKKPVVTTTTANNNNSLPGENVSAVTTTSSSPTTVNVSVNVNLVPSPGCGQPRRRHSAVLEVTPEPTWCNYLPSSTQNSPVITTPSSRSYTSVNLTLRTPTSDPQPPINILSSPTSSSGASLTYITSSFDSRQGLQSRLQITVGPGQMGSVTAMRTRPRSGYLADEGLRETEGVPPLRAGSMPDLMVAGEVTTTNFVVLLSRQLERKEQLRTELEAGRERLSVIKREVQALRVQTTPDYIIRLRKEIRHLQSQCERLTHEVDRHSESRVPLGETNAEFYRNIYTGQRDSLNPHRNRNNNRHQQPISLPPPSNHSAPTTNNSSTSLPHIRTGGSEGGVGGGNSVYGETDNEPRWPCHLCTFRNHPLMDKCEQCDMPRIILVVAGPGENIHIRFTPGNNTRIIHSWVV